MREFEAELVLDAHAILAEGPHWDQESQRLLWVNITPARFTGSIPQPAGTPTPALGPWSAPPYRVNPAVSSLRSRTGSRFSKTVKIYG